MADLTLELSDTFTYTDAIEYFIFLIVITEAVIEDGEYKITNIEFS